MSISIPTSPALAPDEIAAPQLHPEVGALFSKVMEALFRGDQTPEQAVSSFLSQANGRSTQANQASAADPRAALTPQAALSLYQAVQSLGMDMAWSGLQQQQAQQVQQGIMNVLWQSFGAAGYSTGFASGLSAP